MIKSIILYILPQSWLREIYYKGVKDAGAQVVSASYWFSGSGPIFTAVHEVGQNLIEFQGTGIERVRAIVYNTYPESKDIDIKPKVSEYANIKAS